MLKSALATSSPYRSCRFWPTMMSGMRCSWSRLLMNSHTAKAGPGSKRSCAGPTVFQPSQRIVQAPTMKKKPIEPTRSVTHTASRSVGERLRSSSTLTFRVGENLEWMSENFATLAASFSKPWTVMAILRIDARDTLARQLTDHPAHGGRPPRVRREARWGREEQSNGEAARQALHGACGEDRARPGVPTDRGHKAREGHQPGKVRHDRRAASANGRRPQARRPDGPWRGGPAERHGEEGPRHRVRPGRQGSRR